MEPLTIAYLVLIIIGLILVAVGLMGGEFEISGDFDSTPGLLSPIIIGVTLATFGVFGIGLGRNTQIDPFAVFGISLIASIPVYLIGFVIMRKFMGNSTGELETTNLIGTTATVSTTIPENGVGVINYFSNGTINPGTARSADGRRIDAGESVVIERVNSGLITVKKIE